MRHWTVHVDQDDLISKVHIETWVDDGDQGDCHKGWFVNELLVGLIDELRQVASELDRNRQARPLNLHARIPF
jgi:hypothetical protein